MKKCKGCGVELQDQNEKVLGYVKNFDQDYCQRCFRLTHYGDLKFLTAEKINNNETLNLYKQFKNDVFILIIDAFDALVLDRENFLDNFKDLKLLIVINKIDLLPYSVKDEKMEDLYKKVLNKCKVPKLIGCLLTYKNDPTFNELFFDLIKELNVKRFVFVGRVNAGKSTIINKLLKNNDLTVSTYPGTTINLNYLQYEDYEFIDTPGLIDDNSFISHLDKAKLKLLVPNKCVKPKVYQLYDPQAYFIEGLIRIDIAPLKNASLTVYCKNELDIHRSNINKADDYQNKHLKSFELNLLPFKSKEYRINNEITFYVKGLGFIRIKGKSKIIVSVNKQIEVYECGVNL